MPNAFDAADERSSRAMERLLGEPVVVRPMLPRQGGTYTLGPSAAAIDPSRPVRGLAGDPLKAIVTWRPSTADSAPGPGGGRVATVSLVVDFAAADFPDPALRPRQGDRLELPDQNPGERLVEIQLVGSDDSARFPCTCIVQRA